MIGPLSNTVLFGCMWYGEFELDSTFSTILFKRSIDIFTTMIRSQYFGVHSILVHEEPVEFDEPLGKV